MLKRVLVALAFGSLLFGNVSAQAQDALFQQITQLPWLTSPSVGQIGSIAKIDLGGRLQFLDASSTSQFLELNGNPPSSGNYALAPKTLDWFSIFAFNRSGYIRDGEELDPAELLKTLKKQNESGAAERRKLNLEVLHLDGWAVVPHYDEKTKRLEWGTRLIGDNGSVTVNYTVRILGRSGVMRAILVSSPESLNTDIIEFKAALNGFQFIPGERYSEFKQGDKVAEYGLAALIVGGAAAVATKTGILQTFGKFLIFGGIAIVAAIGAFLRKLFRR